MFATMDDTIQVPASLPALSKKTPIKRSLSAIWLVVGLPLLLLGSFVAAKSATLLHGQRVCMHATMFDPYDMMRGSYLQIAFDAPKLTQFSDGQEIYAVYQQGAAKNSQWQPVAAYKQHPKLARGQICLRGTVKQQFNVRSIDFPFSKAFIPANGSSVSNTQTLQAELVVDGNGDAILAGITADGKKIASL